MLKEKYPSIWGWKGFNCTIPTIPCWQYNLKLLLDKAIHFIMFSKLIYIPRQKVHQMKPFFHFVVLNSFSNFSEQLLNEKFFFYCPVLVVETFLIISSWALDPIKRSLNAFALDCLKGELSEYFFHFSKMFLLKNLSRHFLF